MTFPSGIVPKTTNKTAGNTPYPSFARNIKQKLDYSCTGKVVRRVQGGRLLSVHEKSTLNRMFYDILPDGIVCFYAAQATPDGPSGFLAPFINALVKAIALPSSKWAKLLERHHITSVLPLKDMRTGVAQKFYYANGTKNMDRKGIVISNTSDNNSTNCDQICTNLVREAFDTFNIKIGMGGNAANFDLPVLQSVDSKFLAEDVANLAMLSYKFGSFFFY